MNQDYVADRQESPEGKPYSFSSANGCVGEAEESNSLESEADTVTNYLTEVANTNGEISEVGIKWRGEAENVLVAGDFSNWEPLTMSSQGKDLWTGTEH